MFTLETIKTRVVNVLTQIGVYIDYEDLTEDIDLSEYIQDSIQFISFIVELENDLSIEIPDEILNIELIKSLNNLCTTLLFVTNN